MSTLQEVEVAIEKLPKEDFRQLCDWILRRRDDEWDRQIDEAAAAYARDVKTRRFPGDEHTFGTAPKRVTG